MNDITETRFIEIEENKYGITVVFLENAISLFIYEESPIFGTFSVSVPGTSIMPASTLYITGSKNEQFVRIIGERLATKLQKLVLVSLNIEDISGDLLTKIMSKIESEILEENKE
ncbi:MAG: hypothetical protein H7645_00265 [Candidatus Heimdallarchaeota archaeon]|nr:hypothetical protein [Candidatus Heimdallarchaeota archaeon]MCK4768747.1 hypothetical protein [Candidatus Heimdallarchaeota archaeon]